MHGKKIDSILVDALCRTGTRYLGVFPRDLIPLYSLTQFPCVYVSNTDTHSYPGSHWVAFYHESPTHVEFFDSYGQHPKTYGFDVPYNFTSGDYSTNPVQALYATTCGEHCIFYLFQRAHSIPLSTIITTLHESSSPDRYVRRFVSRLRSSIHQCHYCDQICRYRNK